MHLDPTLPAITAITLVSLLLSILLKRFNQPYIIAYLLAGIALGPHGMGIVNNDDAITKLGSLGVVILMFFIGSEVSPTRLAANWRVTVLGTIVRIAISIFIVWTLGQLLEWSMNQILLLAFVLSISSTVVVLQLLRGWKELDTKIGQDALGILLVQDISIVPMIIILGLLDKANFSSSSLILQLVGAVIIIVGVVIIIRKKTQFQCQWLDKISEDKEIQVFASLAACTTIALITGLLQLSTALGAFLAGLVIAKVQGTHWVHNSLNSLQIFFVAIFFLSIGMLIDINFIIDHLYEVGALVLLVLLINSFINAMILKCFGYNWQASIYAGTLLSQIGEFSFILAAIGLNMSIIADYSYQMTISVIALTLLISPVMVIVVRYATKLDD